MNAAVVRVNSTVNVPDSPFFRRSDAGVTVASTPARPETFEPYVAVLLPTFVTVRVTDCLPARDPMAIEAWFRFDASIGVSETGLPSENVTP